MEVQLQMTIGQRFRRNLVDQPLGFAIGQLVRTV